MIKVKNLTDLQHQAVAFWHRDASTTFEVDSFSALILQQHRRNFDLWHEEDIARSCDVNDSEIARVKRSIDKLNQQRNDHIEKIDAAIIEQLIETDVALFSDATLNTETPGSAIDRLSIMSLRIYHMQEQVDRPDAGVEHQQAALQKLERCREQHQDLSRSLSELLDDLFTGRKFLKVYHQFKMYNDPTMNPYLYNRKKSA